MKKLLLLMTVIGMFLFTSCEEDDSSPYSLGDFWLSSGTVTKEVGSYFITTDEGKILWPSASNISNSLLEDEMRVLVNYTILGDATDSDIYDYYVKVNDISQILTKPVFKFEEDTPVEVIDSIGYDAVTILDTWFTGDYLNVEFEYGGGAKVHFINLVYDNDNPETNEGEIILELKHNNNDDPYSYRQWGIASFDVSGFKMEDQTNLDFFVRSVNKNGDYEYNTVVNYSYGEQEQEFIVQGVFNNTDADISSIK